MRALLPQYAELHCLSNFSFLRGASHPAELVERATALGYQALAITDECSFAGVVRAHLAIRERQLAIRLLIGTELRLDDGTRLVLLACTRSGYGDLSQLITRGRMAGEKGAYRLTRDDVATAGLDECVALLLPDPPSTDAITHAPDAARWLAGIFPARAWIAAELHAGPHDREALEALRLLAATSGLPLVAAGDVHMHVRSRRPLQDTLTAIRLGRPVAACGHALFPNAERHLRLRMRLAQVYPPDLLAATLDVAARCTFSLDELRYEYPDELVPAGTTPAAHLRDLVEAGLARRFGSTRGVRTVGPDRTHVPPCRVPDHVRSLIEHELALIAELRYEPYFLTVHDIVRFARERGILCQGRGSAANSAVCYALGITEVDPARMSMLFERFVSRERNEPPDIDVDFEHQRREEVIQYLYAKYTRERAALTATVITYRTRSAVRDLGKAVGLELEQVDRLSKSLAWWDGRQVLPERMREAGFDPESPVMERLATLLGALSGFPRHLSQHTGGFVIARGPLSRLVPIENAAMPDRSVIQWDKDDLDALGLLKVDVLALGMLSAIRRAVEMIDGFWRRPAVRAAAPPWFRARAHEHFTVTDIPPEDPAVYAMIQRAETMGVFQIESRAQMSMLPRLAPACFFDLVIEVAIVRPGPIQGGMVHPYLRRRRGEEPVTYPSEAVRQVLERTLGVPIFQEQVMQLAMVAAGFTAGEADGLRRAMAAWRRKGGLEPFERRLVNGMLERGYSIEFAQAIYRQILGFGEYGFPESHAASFALLVYVSAWIKHHQPAAFLAGLLNSQPMGFYAPSQLIQEARRQGVEVQPVDVLESAWDCTLEESGPSAPTPLGTAPALAVRPSAPGPAVRLGLRMVHGLREDSGARIIAARDAGGGKPAFDSVATLAARAALDQRDLKALAAAGALARLTRHRRDAYWEVTGIERRTVPVLADAPRLEQAPALRTPTEGEDLVADYASLGFTLGRHPIALLRPRLAAARLSSAAELRSLPHGRLARACGIVIGRQRPETAAGIIFVTLEDETGHVNVIVWPSLLERQRREVLGAHLMAVYGVVEREGAVVHLVARRVVDRSEWLGRLTTASRDFH